MATEKARRGQFYTTNYEYILEGLQKPLQNTDYRCIIEPFAGKGDLLNWLSECRHIPIEAYDIDPKRDDMIQRDTLKEPPDYANAWIITNPPYLARNKCEDKTIFDLYNTNDLYKCFIHSLTAQAHCYGGIMIIPAGFFFSPRKVDVRCRNDFMQKYKITKVKYFEETVFADTTTTVVAFSFEKSIDILTEQYVEWEHLPSKETKIFHLSSENDWIIGGDIYKLSVPRHIKIKRYVVGQEIEEGEQQTYMTLNALDSGTKEGRISLQYKEGYLYPAKECSRAFATLKIIGKTLSIEEQKDICLKFNTLIENKRTDTWSLFLPQYRESKEYARKRIPFELAYTIILHIIYLQMSSQTNQNTV